MASDTWNSFLYLYHCGVTGLTPAAPAERPDADRLLTLADRQAATGVIAAALRQNAADYLTPETALRLRMEAASKNLQNRARMEAALDEIEALTAAGIRPVVLKGMSQGVLYRYPESRSSSDTDLFIPLEQEEQTLALLEARGFRVERREPGSNHSECTHPRAGLIEVHVQLFQDLFSKALGRDTGPAIGTAFTEESLWGRTFLTLAPDQNLLYLALHLTKHFAGSWIGLRACYDCALYFARHRDEVNAPALWKELRRLGADTFFNTVLSVMVRADLFDASEFPGMTLQDEDLCDAVASDIEQYDRMAFSHWYTPASQAYLKRQRFRLEPQQDTAKKKWRRVAPVLFPTPGALAERYPAMRRRRWLYPFFWVFRAGSALRSRDRREAMEALRDDTEVPRFSEAYPEQERIPMLRRIGLI